MNNPLENFGILDLADHALRVRSERMLQQARELVATMKSTVASPAGDPGYTEVVGGLLCTSNLEMLKANGFRAWTIDMHCVDGRTLTKHYVSWSLDTFDNTFHCLTTGRVGVLRSTFAEL